MYQDEIAEGYAGDPQVPYLYWNGDKRKLSANDDTNDWNDHNRFVFVRMLCSFSVLSMSWSFFIVLLSDNLVVPATEHFSDLM